MDLLKVRELSKFYKDVKVVDSVSLQIKKGSCLALVGESGSGKSTLARCILRLIEPSQGQVEFNGQSLLKLSGSGLRRLRKKMQMVFQDPFLSLNPRMTIQEALLEPLHIHRLHQQNPLKRVKDLLSLCQLPENSLKRYPHEFSGGQRQRICIARALAVEPEFLVLDEPVSALDVSIQAQILKLLMDLKKEFQLTYMLISHDLRAIQDIADRIAVMYFGKIVELAATQEFFESPRHPYSMALLSAIPPSTNRFLLSGETPSIVKKISGCSLHLRCPRAQARCAHEVPKLKEAAEQDSAASSDLRECACFYPFN